MKNRKRLQMLAVGMLLVVTVLSACSGGSGKSGTAGESGTAPTPTPTTPVKQEPIDLNFLGTAAKERFEREHGNDIKEKFPHIKYYTIDAVTDESKGLINLAEALAMGMPIDIIHVGIAGINA